MRNARVGQFITALAAAAVLAFALLNEDEYSQHVLIWVALNAVLAVGLRFMLLVGDTNIARGAYIAAVFTVKWGLPFPLALLSGGVLGIMVSAAFGMIALRTKGPYFMLISFALTEVIRVIYTRVEWLGGNSGLIGLFPPPRLLAWL